MKLSTPRGNAQEVRLTSTIRTSTSLHHKSTTRCISLLHFTLLGIFHYTLLHLAYHLHHISEPSPRSHRRALTDPSSLAVSLTWFITGTSTGFGRSLVLALLARNQKVVATARKLESIQDLAEKGAVVEQWDVTDELEVLQKKARDIDEKVGGVDVVINE